MSKYFELKEFLRSETALTNQIENLPTWEIVENLKELANFLDGLREAWGGPIRVTSGFRSTELNQKIGGVQLSAHKLGWAADLQPGRNDMEGFKKKVPEWLKGKKFDQCILEKSGSTEWIHISLFNEKHEQRCQVLKLNV